MPVVTLDLGRFSKLVGAERKRILERLPYIGLDIESQVGQSVRVEYSPNRPDFGTDYGIAKALKGLLGIETGLKRYPVQPSGLTVSVDQRLSGVRPFIACATAQGLDLDEEDIRQLISLQEDLHNGLGRRRRKVAIGLHDLDSVAGPLDYVATEPSFRFVPLGGKKPLSLGEILTETETGRAFSSALTGAKRFPVLKDSAGTVLSFPPIVNGSKTRVTEKTTGILIDVTGTDSRSGDDVLAILATTLADMGGRIGTVGVSYQKGRRTTPDLKPTSVRFDADLIARVTGLQLSRKELISCLRRSRLDAVGNRVLVPRYRTDILHPVDAAEEVALGFGIDRVAAEYPASKSPGAFNPFDDFLDKVADIVSGSGMVELMTFELVDEHSLYSNFGRAAQGRIVVEAPRSSEHSVLRDSLIPSMLSVLSNNTKEEYPQRVFEIGRVYRRAEGGVAESWHLGCLIAHAQASFTEAKSYLESFCRILGGSPAATRGETHWAFDEGRSASVLLAGIPIGAVGEVRPGSIAAFGLGVPVSGLELDLTELYKHIK